MRVVRTFALAVLLCACSSKNGETTNPEATPDGAVGDDAASDTALPEPCLPNLGDPTVMPYTPDENEGGLDIFGSDGDAVYLDRFLWGGNTALLRMDKADGKLTELTRSMTDGETLWATLDGDWVYVQRNDRFAEGSTQIQRIPAHGGAAQNVLHMTSAICGFVPHGDHISYDCNTKGGHVAWTAAAGGDALHDFSTVPLQSMVWNGDAFYGFTRDEVHAGGDVVRLALDGSSKVLAHAGDWDDPPVPIGVDDDNVYFRTWGHAAGTVPEEPSRIYRLAKSGGDPVLLATRPYNGIREAHLDCSAITFYGDDADALHRMPKGGGDVDTLVPRNVFGFAVDAHDLVWVERTTAGKTSVHRRSKS